MKKKRKPIPDRKQDVLSGAQERRLVEGIIQSERRAEASERIFEAISDPVLILDSSGLVVKANPAAVKILGFDPASIRKSGGKALERRLGKLNLRRPDGSRVSVEEMPGRRAAKGEKVADETYIVTSARGEDLRLRVSASPVFVEGRLAGSVSVWQDISERERLLLELKERAEEAEKGRGILDAIMEYIPEGITVAEGPDVVVRMISNYGQQLIGRPREDLENAPAAKHWRLLKAETGSPGRPEELPLVRAVKKGEVIVNEEWVLRPEHGADLTVLCNAGPIRDKKGNITGGIIAWRDITERKRMEEAVRFQAYHDLLTGLPNKTLFMERLGMELTLSRRKKKTLAVLFLDLDRFKGINDTMGHTVGDGVLKEVAERLRACMRGSDTIARIGGDEFAVMLPEIELAEEAAKTVNKIISAFQPVFRVEGHELHMSTSIGISIYPGDGDYPEILLKNADMAMYHAKEHGRNNYQFYNSAMNARAFQRLVLEGSLRRALERGEMVLHYQPLIEMQTRRLTGAEALVRWKHPELGLLSPAQFIPLAEETGVIEGIDGWVLRAACRQARAWHKKGYPFLTVTVNLSRKKFERAGLPRQVSHALKEAGLKAGSLEVEIAEDAAMRAGASTLPNLSELAGMGVGCTIDGFGSGYSSLGVLKKLPVRKLKIARTFVAGLSEEPDYRAVINAAIALAHTMKLEVAAEGVETEEQFSFLHSSRCDEIQGFLFSEPVPAEEFDELIESYA
jgi:diguanylate cyclase (GGDEF)-like protein/PAS domain S-box-containing protein